jgi:type II secretory pathway component GspD/PulD (secretin)
MKNPLRIFRIKSKLLRILFSQLILSVVFFGISSANGGYAQELLNKRITLKVENRSIKQVLNEIEKSAEIRFIYSSSLIRSERKITLALDKSTLGEVLGEHS